MYGAERDKESNCMLISKNDDVSAMDASRVTVEIVVRHAVKFTKLGD